MPVNYITIPQVNTANYAPGADGTPAPYQKDSTPVPNQAKADGRLGTGSNIIYIPKSTPVPNPTKADGSAGIGSNLRFIKSSTPVPNSSKTDGELGTGSNTSFTPSKSNTRITYVPNPTKADGTDGAPSGPVPSTPTSLDIDVTTVTADSTTWFTVLTWQDTQVPGNFEIWRSVNGGAYALLATVSGSVLTYSDDCTTELLMSDFTTHTYKVRAKTGSSFSSFSNEIESRKGINFINDSVTVSLSFPLLVISFFDVMVQGNTALLSVSFPKLKQVCTEFFVTGNTSLNSWSAPMMTTIGFTPVFDELELDSNNFTTLDVSAIVHINSTNFSAGSNTNLTTITFNANPIIADGNSLIFDVCALNAATINRILAICVANNLTQAFIKLDAGTNSAPTGQGITDKNTLITNGCTVITN